MSTVGAFQFPEDVNETLDEYTPYADELVTMAIIRSVEFPTASSTPVPLG